jgi:hypothetical protein
MSRITSLELACAGGRVGLMTAAPSSYLPRTWPSCAPIACSGQDSRRHDGAQDFTTSGKLRRLWKACSST